MLEHIKRNAIRLFISSAVILLPMLVGVLLWDKMPEKVVTHWGVNGEPNGWSSRGFAVFGVPLFLLAVHWLCSLADRNNFAINAKPMWLVFWACPAVSLFCGTAVYTEALGYDVHIENVASILLGAMFIAVGNYLPKCRQNRTLGIKLKWTFESEANWNATHRFAGRLWVAAGVITLLCALLPEAVSAWVMLPVMLGACFAPIVYSYLYHKKETR